MANAFYEERINQHLLIGIEAVRILRDEIGPDQLQFAQAQELRRASVPLITRVAAFSARRHGTRVGEDRAWVSPSERLRIFLLDLVQERRG